MDAIQIRGLTKQYRDVTAVKNLELTIRQGELFALLGVNGAGKSTTIKMLSGLVQPTSGDAVLEGYSITKDSGKAKSILAVSPQESAVAPNLTVEENLHLICGIYGLSGERVAEVMAGFDLTEYRRKRAGKLSGGWQRRLSLAMALISQPKILFLDEPTLGLDVLARAELWDRIRELKGKITIILTTHYMEEAEQLSDRIGIMQRGRLLRVGTVGELTEATGTQRLEEAFIQLAKEGAQ